MHRSFICLAELLKGTWLGMLYHQIINNSLSIFFNFVKQTQCNLNKEISLITICAVLALVIVPVISVAVRRFGRFLRELSHQTQAAAALASSIAEVCIPEHLVACDLLMSIWGGGFLRTLYLGTVTKNKQIGVFSSNCKHITEPLFLCIYALISLYYHSGIIWCHSHSKILCSGISRDFTLWWKSRGDA